METRERLTVTNRILLANPSDSGEYALRLYPYSLERAALLSQIEHDEENGLESAQTMYDEEKTKIEDEWKKGKERIRERLLESLEERRKKAREEMASDGALAGELLLRSYFRFGCMLNVFTFRQMYLHSILLPLRVPQHETGNLRLSYLLHPTRSGQLGRTWCRLSHYHLRRTLVGLVHGVPRASDRRELVLVD